jgi:NAD+ synthase (glutamine-hydrolysing)
MKDGFIKLAAATPDIRVADTQFNTENIIKAIHEANENGAKVIVLPELCVSAYTCSDLFLQRTLQDGVLSGLKQIKKMTKNIDITAVIGAPLVLGGALYNCAVVINCGSIKGIVPKKNIPNYGEFYELRHFTPGSEEVTEINLLGESVPFGGNILFTSDAMEEFCMGVEICEDLWAVNPPSCAHALAGATVIVNPSASNEIISKAQYRGELIKGQSARLYCAYVYADAGFGESTTDLVFAGDNIIAENGNIIARSERFINSCVYATADLERLSCERRKNTTFRECGRDKYTYVKLHMEHSDTELGFRVNPRPFVPSDDAVRQMRSEEILTIQSMGLAKRIEHTNAKTAVIGVSGGLDSTLALLVAVRAFDCLGRSRKDIYAVTMPCFGTTDRTYNNAVNFAKSLGTTFMEIPIADAVKRHFKDIGHDSNDHDVTYENSQARERTQVLMDIANKTGGLVVGTGDLSEFALGWATYNGDHMSMYGVNAGVPKTLIRYLVDYEASRTNSTELKETLRDILATPVSPELLPPEDGKISQKTEDIVGPYELHDFFLFYMLRFGFRPAKILRLAENAFCGTYDREFILGWLKTFYRRFFNQQFKRSCMPDAPKVGSVALSPRGDWRMPSDASYNIWKNELDIL